MPVGSLRLILPVISAIVAGAMVAAACGGSDDPQPLTEPTPDASTPIEQQAPAVDDQAAADAPQQDDQPDEPAAPAEDDIALEEPEEPTAVGTYTVQTGDNLSSIAVQFNTSVDEIVALNNLANPNALSVGQVLRIPGGDFPEDEETVADTPEEQEQPDDDEYSTLMTSAPASAQICVTMGPDMNMERSTIRSPARGGGLFVGGGWGAISGVEGLASASASAWARASSSSLCSPRCGGRVGRSRTVSALKGAAGISIWRPSMSMGAKKPRS